MAPQNTYRGDVSFSFADNDSPVYVGCTNQATATIGRLDGVSEVSWNVTPLVLGDCLTNKSFQKSDEYLGMYLRTMKAEDLTVDPTWSVRSLFCWPGIDRNSLLAFAGTIPGWQMLKVHTRSTLAGSASPVVALPSYTAQTHPFANGGAAQDNTDIYVFSCSDAGSGRTTFKPILPFTVVACIFKLQLTGLTPGDTATYTVEVAFSSS